MAGQLIVRLREANSLHRKYDQFDVYDGPFRVLEIPTTSTSADTLFEDSIDSEDWRLATDRNRKSAGRDFHDERMIRARGSQKMVKLDIPSDSKSQEWCSLDRLIPVYDVPRRCDTISMTQYQVFKAAQHAGIQSEPAAAHAPSGRSNDCKIFKLNEQIFVTCSFVSSQGLSEGLFEVDKLRAKRTERRLAEYYLDEPQNTTEVKAFLKKCRKQKLDPRYRAVTEYLVHWSGWPSEDDTWERGFGNIPQSIIDDFNNASKGEQSQQAIV